MKITLVSKFHNQSSATIDAELLQPLTESQIRKVSKALCGMKDCTCGGINAYPLSADEKYTLIHQEVRGETSYWLESNH